jgi:hypothetical protein
MLRIIIALLAFAVAVQNTCPYGYAGKTAVAAPHVHTCPLKDHQPVRSDAHNDVNPHSSHANGPFVFISVLDGGAFMACGPAEKAGSCKVLGYEDIFLKPPLRPPVM